MKKKRKENCRKILPKHLCGGYNSPYSFFRLPNNILLLDEQTAMGKNNNNSNKTALQAALGLPKDWALGYSFISFFIFIPSQSRFC